MNIAQNMLNIIRNTTIITEVAIVRDTLNFFIKIFTNGFSK